MTEQSELVTPESRALERRWEQQGRKITQVCERNYPDYKTRLKFVNRTALDQVSAALDILPCPACIHDGMADPNRPTPGIVCTRLVVTIEKHPLQDTGNIVNTVCHYCGHQEMWPFKMQEYAYSDSAKVPFEPALGVAAGLGMTLEEFYNDSNAGLLR